VDDNSVFPGWATSASMVVRRRFSFAMVDDDTLIWDAKKMHIYDVAALKDEWRSVGG